MRSRSIGVGLMAAFVALWCFALFSVTAQELNPSDGVEAWTEPSDWTETASSTKWGESKPTPAVVHPAVVSRFSRSSPFGANGTSKSTPIVPFS